MTEADVYEHVLRQEIGNIKNGIREAAIIGIPLLINSGEEVIHTFKDYIKNKKISNIAIEYYMIDTLMLYVLVYNTKFKLDGKSPAEIFKERWEADKDGTISEILLERYYRMIGCSKEVIARNIKRELNKKNM